MDEVGFRQNSLTEKVLDKADNKACAAIVHSFSSPWTTFEFIYTNTFTSRLSSGLDKTGQILLGQDKPRLELAVG